MHQQYRDRVAFLFVYIREAHPSDEWQLDENTNEDVVLTQPVSFGERREVANQCSQALALSMPCVIDDMDNTADTLYAAWPERMFVVDVNGRIAYAGGQGPFGFKPEEVAAWLGRHVGPAGSPGASP